MDTHNILRQINYLGQVLSHDKKPIALFLGAGCPTAIPHPTETGKKLLPDIVGLTEHIQSIFKINEHEALYAKLCNHFTEDGKTPPNVEEILTHIRSLRQVCGVAGVRGLTSQNLDDLEKVICDKICTVMMEKLPAHNTPYHNVSAWMSRQRGIPVEIFTTNYDLLMEQALEETSIPYFDGFVGGREPFFDTHAVEEDLLPSRWSRLWKLHGSINWYLSDSSKNVIRGFGLDNEKRKVVIHPSHLKYDESRRMPYLALLDKLKMFFKKPSAALIICGYSFGDEHINEIIIEGLKGNPTAIVFGLLFGPMKNYMRAQKLAQKRSNLSLLAEDEGIIGTRNGTWNCSGLDEGQTGISVIKDTDADQVKEIRFKLGDFHEFGDFTIQLVGKDIGADGQPEYE